MNQVLINIRKERGLTIAKAAECIGISYGMLAMLETKKRRGSDKTKIIIAKFYNRTVEELFYNDN
ncbi:helix-turn-helix transcriptional regulator [Paenibacillus lautus]|uniref:helix-turn-helix transcriptional regulator n=1 Tax=Paenibacillus lautus TaxID=1401 RepID=UPI003D2E375B